MLFVSFPRHHAFYINGSMYDYVLKLPVVLLMQDIDEKAEEAYRKMEDAFRVQLGLVPDGVAVT
jgi:hypothetical protein